MSATDDAIDRSPPGLHPGLQLNFLLVGNPENRRVEMFRHAAADAGVACSVLSWEELVAGAPLDVDAKTVVRIESPGENWAVERALIRVGRAARDVDPDDWDDAEELGRIRGIGDHFRGLKKLVEGLPDDVRYMSDPASIIAMFDKVETKRRLVDAGIGTPRLLGTAADADEFFAVVGEERAHRVFVKPRHASSASGVIALSRRADEVVATTSIELAGERLYNSLKIRVYRTLGDLRRIIELLAEEDEIVIEEWVPKDSAQASTYDLRFVPIGTNCDHAVMRCSSSPMTNLHLGNRRGDLEELVAELGSTWGEARNAARRALRQFSGSLYAGVDVGITAGRKSVVVFEVNAFGDLVPGVVDTTGRSTYSAEIAAMLGMGDGN